jgi:Leucine-rich repeat (LRR) protein
MEDGSPIIIAALSIVFAAFGIWLTVRLINREKKPLAKQFTCVGLSIAVGALSVGLSIWIPYDRERQVIKRIESWGGAVDTYPMPDWLRQLVGEHRLSMFKVFDRVARVQLSGTSVADAEIAHLTGLANIEALYLNGTKVTDLGLADLRKLTKLDCLTIRGTAVTDSGLAHLGRLKNLELLDLSKTAVTDAGLAHLSGLTNLGWLNLSETGVTDAGLKSLTGLEYLAVLEVHGTAVTNKGYDELKDLTAISNPDYIHVWPFQHPERPPSISAQRETH